MMSGSRTSLAIRGVQLILGITVAVIASSATPRDADRHVRSEMLVSTNWLASHLQDKNLVVLCIVDDEQFYSRGHIPESRVIRLSQLVTTRGGVPNQLPSVGQLQQVFEGAGVKDHSRIILYGERSGVMASRAYFTLDYLGLADRAALLDGGVEKWRAEGRPEATVAPQVAKTKLKAEPHPEILVGTQQMAEYSRAKPGSSAPVLIDARPREEYEGQRLSEDVSKAGHIPEAIGVYWREMLIPGDIPQLRSPADLRKLFALPPENDKEVVTYCRTGMQSSFDYFVLKYLGYKPRMYDGSFYEWSRSPLPVESGARDSVR
jgi:thiosulfate/3-mercaptopyruvate sulfurtransferase